MKKFIAEMPSYTYAVKGEKLLRSRGFDCKIVRSEKSCGYSLLINTSELNATKAFNILEKNAVPYERGTDQ